MPTLKQLSCSVEWDLSQTPLQEFQTTYSDGYVETYIAVPELPTPFSIHLQSYGYIAPGLSMFVYIDGVYQCNRNRQNLRIPAKNTTKKQTEVNFRVRQKEQMSWDGTFHGKPWRFAKANIVSDSSIDENERAPHDGEYVGAIEVVVLRCLPSVTSNRSSDTLVNKDTAISSDSSSDSDGLPNSLDGPSDGKWGSNSKPKSKYEPCLFGLDGSWDDPVSPLSPNDEQKESQDNSWGSWGEVPATAENPSDQSWDNSVPPSLPTGSSKKPHENSSHGWGEVPATTEKPSTDTWGNWNEQIPAENEKKMGTVKMTSADTGTYHPPSVRSSKKGPPRSASVSGSTIRSGAGSITGSRTGSQGSKSHEKRAEPSSTRQEPSTASKAGSVAGSRTGSQSGNSWGNWKEASSSRENPKTRSKAASIAGASADSHSGTRSRNASATWNQPPSNNAEPQSGKTRSTTPRTETYRPGSNAGPPSSSQEGRSRRSPSLTGQQTPRALELRGGGSSSYSARSHRSSTAGSPIFNVGFYNGVGTPPSLDQGPPPPRNWQAEEAAKKTSNKQGYKPVKQPVDDAWGDLPAFDVSNDATAAVEPDPQDKVDDWNAGGSNMPGSWDRPNSQTKDESNWGATNEKPQENDGDAWGAPPYNGQNHDSSKDADLGVANGGAQDNGTWPGAGQPSDWDDPAKENNKDSNSDNGSNNNGQDWAGAADNNQSSGEWNGNNNNNNNGNTQQDNDWNAGSGEDKDTQQNGGWANNEVEDTKVDKEKPASVKGSKKGSKTGSVGKGSKTGGNAGSDTATSVKSKGKSPSLKGPGNAAGSKKGSAAGGWSPTPKSKKGASPKIAEPVNTNAQVRPGVSMPTVPRAKAYWSTWKNPNGEEREAEVVEAEPANAAEEPLYAIPEAVAIRNNTSHQVQPGRTAAYSHKVSRPKYMDTHESPYAVFVFQYRDKAIIETMLQTTISEPEIDEKQRLSSLPKAELIEELLKQKARSTSGSSGSEKAATFNSNPLGIPLEPDANALKAKLNTLDESKAATPEMVGAWVDSSQQKGNRKGNSSAEGKGNWGKKPKNKGDKKKGGGTWGANGGHDWNKDKAKDEDTEAEPWSNTEWPTADNQKDEKKDDEDGNWGGFDQDAGATSWGNEEKKDEGKGDADEGGFGGGTWGETSGGGGGGGGGW